MRDPAVNKSYSKISIRIITWIRIDLAVVLLIKFIQLVFIVLDIKTERGVYYYNKPNLSLEYKILHYTQVG